MEGAHSISLDRIVQEFNLEVVCGDPGSVKVFRHNVNRPGLQIVGYYDYFDNQRIQMIGRMEWSYLAQLTPEQRAKSFDDLFSRPIPALIVARSQEIFPECREAAEKYGRVLLASDQPTVWLQTNIIAALTRYLAPCITRHGVLVEVYGEGILLMGESGVGKSETAVELIKRGHRLIADDAVEIRRVGPDALIGMAPELIRYYVELRGIGVVDVRRLFGMAAVKDSQEINMVINMELWRDGMLYDRLGLEDRYTSILDVPLPTLTVPVKPGRNLAVIIEVAAMNNRDKKMGYNAAKEFTDQINAHFDQQLAGSGRM
ncbi:MAG: HPr(Ser) kinase/phosphatase [Oscillospiraceae bacterium]|nr:HPr(Ser) kinase/phosphatase [Oscillospiraceae bacterium]